MRSKRFGKNSPSTGVSCHYVLISLIADKGSIDEDIDINTHRYAYYVAVEELKPQYSYQCPCGFYGELMYLLIYTLRKFNR